MKFSSNQEFERQLINMVTMINFILAMSIISGMIYAVYRVGTWIWG